MLQKELDLIQLNCRSVAQPSAGPTQIMRYQYRDAGCRCPFLHDVPDRFLRNALTTCLSDVVYPGEQFSSINSSRNQPIVQLVSHPIANGNSSSMTRLPTKSTIAQGSSQGLSSASPNVST